MCEWYDTSFLMSNRYRFDAPHAEYPVLYACASQVGTFAEVYGDRARRRLMIERERKDTGR